MRLIKLLLIVPVLFFAKNTIAQSATDSLLNKLNSVLANKDEYVKKKEADIGNLKQQVAGAGSPKAKYSLFDSLYEQYKSFSYDSSYNYAKKLKATSIELKDPYLIASAKMKLAFTLLSSGLFKETLEELNSVNISSFPAKDKAEYYFLKARTYFDLADYNRNSDYTAAYNPPGISCIDSAMALSQPGSIGFLELKGLRDLEAKQLHG